MGEVIESIVPPTTSSQWFLIACCLEIDGIRGTVQPRTLCGNRRTEVRSCEGSYLALLSVMHILLTLAFEDRAVGRDKCSFTKLLLLNNIRDCLYI